MTTLEFLLEKAAFYGMPVPPYPQPPAQNKYVVTADKLTVRRGPGPWNERIRYVDQGDVVTAMREQDGWAEIAPGQWVNMEYLRRVRSAQ